MVQQTGITDHIVKNSDLHESINVEVCLNEVYAHGRGREKPDLMKLEKAVLLALKNGKLPAVKHIDQTMMDYDKTTKVFIDKVNYIRLETNVVSMHDIEEGNESNENGDPTFYEDEEIEEKPLDVMSRSLLIFSYELFSDMIEEMDEDASASMIARQWKLPNRMFESSWESLNYNSNIKGRLLNYVTTLIYFSERSVDKQLISSNNIVLLYGPSGTGKSTLCQALAQKLSIRLSRRYKYGKLIEINANSLLSKYFSESCKLVQEIFARVIEALKSGDSFIFLLIDEVESIAMSRTKSASGSEPSDAVRVVNVMLTQLDHIKRFSNIIVLMTSNMKSSIDSALLDRIDIKINVGLPNLKARLQISVSFIEELIRKNIIVRSQVSEDGMHEAGDGNEEEEDLLYRAVENMEGMSGRTVKKLPFLVCTNYIQQYPVSLHAFLELLDRYCEHAKRSLTN